MKSREFWVRPNINGVSYAYTSAPPHFPDAVLVREVSSELDKAYEECEKALSRIMQSECDYPNGEEDSHSSWSRNALAALKKARGET